MSSGVPDSQVVVTGSIFCRQWPWQTFLLLWKQSLGTNVCYYKASSSVCKQFMARNNHNNDGILITCRIKIHVKIQLRLKKWVTNSVTLLLVLTGTYKVILLQDSVLSHGQIQCLEKRRRENLEPTREHKCWPGSSKTAREWDVWQNPQETRGKRKTRQIGKYLRL